MALAIAGCCLHGSAKVFAEAASDRAPPPAASSSSEANGTRDTLGPYCSSWVPFAPGVDQGPSDPAQYGKCTSAVDQHIVGPSNWCQFGRLGQWPSGPTRKAQQCLKNGRMTVYRGPVLGSEPNHKGACNGEDGECSCVFDF